MALRVVSLKLTSATVVLNSTASHLNFIPTARYFRSCSFYSTSGNPPNSNPRNSVDKQEQKVDTISALARNSTNNSVLDSLFDSLKRTSSDDVISGDLLEQFNRTGILLDDPRLRLLLKSLKKIGGVGSDQRSNVDLHYVSLDRNTFRSVIQDNLQMLIRAMTNNFCIPDFKQFAGIIEEVFSYCHANNDGKLASYIPQLEQVDPTLWGVSCCTVDGQRLSLGDWSTPFTLQSSSKPLTYALALTELGPDVVHQYVGYEPSGVPFNQIILNNQNRPHNPLINSGALAICSILQSHLSPPERFRYVENKFSQLAGGQTLGFNNAVYLSERASANRNFAIAYYMKENRCFPEPTSLSELMDFYLQICSIEGNCDAVSVIASTLANGGINPLTGDRLISHEAARDTLSVMHSCGMYDYSGQFAFKVGLPCKSGVSGVILVVVPNLMGLALYSPLIDKHGNSVRGVQFCQELVQRFIFHHYESQLHADKKVDPRKRDLSRVDAVTALLFAAENNDLTTLRMLYISGTNFQSVDYDGRTGLHVAASSGALDAVKFFIEVAGVHPKPIDRWGHTPLSEAMHFNHTEIVEYLESVIDKAPT